VTVDKKYRASFQRALGNLNIMEETRRQMKMHIFIGLRVHSDE
jgi:hypothetical protein